MTLRDALAPLPDSALVPVSWIREQLAADTAPATAPDALPVDLTVEQVASQFGKAASTVRTWCAHGELSGAYLLHGREWRIPPTAVAALQRTQAEKHAQTAPQPRSATISAPDDIGAWRQHLPTQKAS